MKKKIINIRRKILLLEQLDGIEKINDDVELELIQKSGMDLVETLYEILYPIKMIFRRIV